MSIIKTIGPPCTLGEGPLWHPLTQRLFWFDIPKRMLYSCDEQGGTQQGWQLDQPVSAAGWIDEATLLIAAADGLRKFDTDTGHSEQIVSLNADDPNMRSNDGRTGPDGSFWFGTMAIDMTADAGAYYRFAHGELTELFNKVSVPNATCFSPDGRTAYLADTQKHIIWRWALDEQGNPVGDKKVHIDLSKEGLNPDGAVCDAEGYLWNAQWGASRLARYAPDGSLHMDMELPISQPTCPVFGGKDLKTLYVTSASERLSGEQISNEPDCGKIFMIQSKVAGIAEHQVKI